MPLTLLKQLSVKKLDIPYTDEETDFYFGQVWIPR